MLRDERAYTQAIGAETDISLTSINRNLDILFAHSVYHCKISIGSTETKR
jgi:hypothetical protein